MVQKKTVMLIDDLNGEPAAETVQFGLGQHWLEIDLSAENAAQLRAIFAEYIEHGRLVSGRRPARSTAEGQPGARRSPKARAASRNGYHPLAFSSVVRAWAREQGLTVGVTGRISNAVIEQFERRPRGRARRGR